MAFKGTSCWLASQAAEKIEGLDLLAKKTKKAPLRVRQEQFGCRNRVETTNSKPPAG